MNDRPNLLSLLLTLQPMQQASHEQTLPLWWGRAAHALLLNTVHQYNPKLAEDLHEDSVIRPFTVSTLMGPFPQGKFNMEYPYTLRLTAYSDELAEIIHSATCDGPLAMGRQIEMDYHPFRILQVSMNATPSFSENAPAALSPWACATTYQQLSAPLLLAKQPAPRRITLQFTSPTTFKSNEKHIPIPLPELVFGSLLERWNAFAPIAFPPETRRYAAECLAIGRYHLSSRPVPTKSGGMRIGAVGRVGYTTLNYDRYWMSVIAVLAAFALFAGVGAGTTMGLGQCRPVAEEETIEPQVAH